MGRTKKKSSRSVWIITGVVAFVFVFLGGGFIYMLSSDKGGGKKVYIAKLELVRPNLPDKPPPPPKEKPPEPEQVKKEVKEIMMAPQTMSQPMEPAGPKGDGKPTSDGPLGVDADGGAGSDGFGLAGRKGQGRDLLKLGSGTGGGGGFDQGGLLRKFAWYTNHIQEDVRKRVRERLDRDGGIPKGRLEAQVEIVIDNKGVVVDFRIIRPSGNRSMDEAVKESLKVARINEPPPQGIPRKMNIRITSQG